MRWRLSWSVCLVDELGDVRGGQLLLKKALRVQIVEPSMIDDLLEIVAPAKSLFLFLRQ